MRKSATIFGVLVASLLTAAPAAATPVATSDGAYQALGAVFPDPQATCSRIGAEPCSPNARGNVPATQFIQWQEFLGGLEYMNSKPDWQRYMEVMVLDGKLRQNGAGEGPSDEALGVGDSGNAMFPGNNLPLEFDPKPEYRSVGLARPDLERQRSDLITVRVTDESVPDAGKERYALSLSIHGIERAGAEGGTRAIEELVTATQTGLADDPIVPESAKPGAPTFAEVLRETVIYFTYPNPDGWRRGSIADTDKGPGVFFQRYNGNGVDLNRDWPDIGFSFRPYSGLSEPESRALSGALTEIEDSTGAQFAAGDDLHGQPFADALSYTLLPHGRHDFAKNERLRDTSITIHRASEEALVWSPIVQPNDAPQGGGVPCTPTLGDTCAQIYGQTWGTVYDTINYTTTGTVGDWFDSSVGLGADGIDNEMSFSHLDRNIIFDPHTEQLHVDGNKALIYAHLATIVDPAESSFDAPGTKGYVANERLVRAEQDFQPAADGTVAQTDISSEPKPQGPDGTTVFPIEVKQGPQPDDGSPDAGNDIYNGGMRVDITEANAQGVATGNLLTGLKVQCKACEDGHVGEPEDEWITVAEDYNQSAVYLQAGLTGAVNRPQAIHRDGSPVEWRALVEGPTGAARMDVDFTSGPATVDGSTNGDPPPKLAGYDVANTDFFRDLNPSIPGEANDFREIDPRAVIAGEQSLDGLDSLVLADNPLPGYTGPFDGDEPRPSGPPSEDISFEMKKSTLPGQGPEGCVRSDATIERFEFAVAENAANESMTVGIEWSNGEFDYDLILLRKTADGGEQELDRSDSFNVLTGPSEAVDVERPAPGDYIVEVVNCTAAPTSDVDPWSGRVDFTPLPPASDTGTGTYTVAEKDAWFDALGAWVEGGGNLVLTDGSLRSLGELTPVPGSAVKRQTVYVGQVTFDESDAEDDATTDHPLASDPVSIEQPGARFNIGMRRQTYEPTPLGFAIQNETGGDDSNAVQYDVDKAAWTGAGGTVAATGVNSSPDAAEPMYDRVALGEMPVGAGQIRIAGSLLPQPTTEFNHTFGIEPYATTYTGYILARNLLEVDASGSPVTPPAGGGGDGSGGGGDGTGGGGDGTGTAPNEGGPKPGQGDGVERCERGDKGRDKLRGDGGDDCLKGRRGKDRLHGGAGDDRLSGGRGNDRITGGPGADVIRCGAGRNDRARTDAADTVSGCEKVRER